MNLLPQEVVHGPSELLPTCLSKPPEVQEGRKYTGMAPPQGDQGGPGMGDDTVPVSSPHDLCDAAPGGHRDPGATGQRWRFASL